MRASASLPPAPPPGDARTPRSDWGTIAKLLPYLWRYRWRVALALGFMLGAKLANVGVPVLLMFLGVGMLAGSDGPGGIYFDNAVVANFIGSVALAYILFSGGLDTSWRDIRPVLWRGALLATVGVAATAGLLGLFVWMVLDFSLVNSLLLASIVLFVKVAVDDALSTATQLMIPACVLARTFPSISGNAGGKV